MKQIIPIRLSVSQRNWLFGVEAPYTSKEKKGANLFFLKEMETHTLREKR